MIPDFVGYLPLLKDGKTYVTKGGTNITLTVKGGSYFVNNARIVQANLVLENEFAYVVDQVCKPSDVNTIIDRADRVR